MLRHAEILGNRGPHGTAHPAANETCSYLPHENCIVENLATRSSCCSSSSLTETSPLTRLAVPVVLFSFFLSVFLFFQRPISRHPESIHEKVYNPSYQWMKQPPSPSSPTSSQRLRPSRLNFVASTHPHAPRTHPAPSTPPPPAPPPSPSTPGTSPETHPATP